MDEVNPSQAVEHIMPAQEESFRAEAVEEVMPEHAGSSRCR